MASTAAGGAAFRRPAHVAYVVDRPDGDRGASGVAVLLHLPTGRRVSLSETATAVWLAVADSGQRGARVADLAAGLASRYGADQAEVAADVQRLFDELTAADLLEPTP